MLALTVLAGGKAPRKARSYAWTAPVPFNTNATTDFGGDSYTQVRTGGAVNILDVLLYKPLLGIACANP